MDILQRNSAKCPQQSFACPIAPKPQVFNTGISVSLATDSYSYSPSDFRRTINFLVF